MTMFDDAYQLLDSLGSTPAEVATTLANKGIVGYRGEPLRCPLAVLLHEQFPDGHLAVVAADVMAPARQGTHYVAVVPLPDACSEFVRLFDRGQQFPELRAPGEPPS